MFRLMATQNPSYNSQPFQFVMKGTVKYESEEINLDAKLHKALRKTQSVLQAELLNSSPPRLFVNRGVEN